MAQAGASGSQCSHQSYQHSQIEARVFCFPDQGTQGGPVAGVAGTLVEPDPPSPATASDVAETVGKSVESAAHNRVISFNSCGLVANLVNVVRTLGGTWIDPWCFEIHRCGRVELCGDEDRIWSHKIREAARLVRWRRVKRRNFRDVDDGVDLRSVVSVERAHTVKARYFEIHTG